MRERLVNARSKHHIEGIMMLDLSEDEKLALAALLKLTIEDDRCPLSPRLRPLNAILEAGTAASCCGALPRAEAI